MNPSPKKSRKNKVLYYDLIHWLAEYKVQSDKRPKFGKGSDRSDLFKKLRNRIIRKYKVILR